MASSLIAFVFAIAIVLGCVSANIINYDNQLNSQLWLNGTTSITRKSNDSNVRIHYHQPRDPSIPLFDYSSEFDVFRQQLNRLTSTHRPFLINGGEVEDMQNGDVNKSEFACSDKMIQKCKDDEIELDFLQGKAISLEIDKIKLESNYNLTNNLLLDCRRSESLYKHLSKQCQK